MAVHEICKREVVTAYRGDSVAEAARLMKRHRIGVLVILDREAELRRPVGILTDRDLAIRVVAEGLAPETTPIGEAMSSPVVFVHEIYNIHETMELMLKKGVRRFPVVNDSGELTGIVTMDDVLSFVAGEIAMLGHLIKSDDLREADARV